MTGVHVNWLLKNLKCEPFVAVPDTYVTSLKGRMLRVRGGREAYTRETFLKAQRLEDIPEFIGFLIPDYMFSFYSQLRAILSNAAKSGLSKSRW